MFATGNVLKKFRGLFTRQQNTFYNSWQNGRVSFLPTVGNEAQNLAIISLVLRVFTDSCLRFPLEVLNGNKEPVRNHYLLKLFERPAPF